MLLCSGGREGCRFRQLKEISVRILDWSFLCIVIERLSREEGVVSPVLIYALNGSLMLIHFP